MAQSAPVGQGPNVPDRAPMCADGHGLGRFGTIQAPPAAAATGAPAADLDLCGVVEPALARALLLAAEAQRWDIVVQIAGELQARRARREEARAVAGEASNGLGTERKRGLK